LIILVKKSVQEKPRGCQAAYQASHNAEFSRSGDDDDDDDNASWRI
jgi:hypothetical protein